MLTASNKTAMVHAVHPNALFVMRDLQFETDLRRMDTMGQFGGAFKRQGAESQPSRTLPSNAVLCRQQARTLQFDPGVGTTATNQESAMGEPSPGTPPPERPPEDRLDSWKEIAAYLNRDVTTVQRWEKREGMPVHRHLHDRMGSVYASRAELDAWARGRNLRVSTGRTRTMPASPDPSSAAAALCDLDLSEPDGRSSCRWQRRESPWRLARASGCRQTEYFWRNPIADARFQTVTDFDGVEQAAAVSRDGHFVAFLSDRDGQMDVWVTQVGSGQFHNLTRGSAPELVNPSVRTLGFSPDGSFVTFWVRKPGRLERRRHQHLGGANAGRTAEAIPRRRGRVRLVARRLPTRVPHARTRRPAVRVRRQPAIGRLGPSSPRPPGSTLTFRCGRPTRHSSTSSRARSRTNSTSGASRPAGGTPERITSHNGRVTSSGPVGSADADVPRQRSRWFRAVAL